MLHNSICLNNKLCIVDQNQACSFIHTLSKFLSNYMSCSLALIKHKCSKHYIMDNSLKRKQSKNKSILRCIHIEYSFSQSTSK